MAVRGSGISRNWWNCAGLVSIGEPVRANGKGEIGGTPIEAPGKSELINAVPLRGRGALPRVRFHGTVFLLLAGGEGCKFGTPVERVPTVLGHTTSVLVFAGMK